MGRDKLSLVFGGRSLLESAVDRFNECFDRVIVSVSDLTRYPDVKAERIADIYKDAGPMSALFAAIKYTGDDVFLTAADMPFSSRRRRSESLNSPPDMTSGL
jgi:molybdopterin-guanine dinucleotide biosynthesis protein A